jgi:hypothetical protein
MATENFNITKEDPINVGDAVNEIMSAEDSNLTKVDIIGGGDDAGDALDRPK